MAEWIVDGQPEWEVWALDIRRFGATYASQRYTLARTYEALSKYYDIKYPGEERKAGRPLRVSPAYPRHAALGAVVRREVGLGTRELVRVNAAGGDESLRPRGWAGENWSPAIAAEAARHPHRGGLFDESSFAKIEVVGPGALDLLQRLCANDVSRPVGRVTYTQMLNHHGGIECDLSVIRTAEDRFLLITGTAFGTHDRRWIERHAPRDGSVARHST